jgi:hypothetical protein
LVFAGYTTGTPSVDVWIRHSNGVPITGELATELSQAQQKIPSSPTIPSSTEVV